LTKKGKAKAGRKSIAEWNYPNGGVTDDARRLRFFSWNQSSGSCIGLHHALATYQGKGELGLLGFMARTKTKKQIARSSEETRGYPGFMPSRSRTWRFGLIQVRKRQVN
jgi:hypothetical protein